MSGNDVTFASYRSFSEDAVVDKKSNTNQRWKRVVSDDGRVKKGWLPRFTLFGRPSGYDDENASEVEKFRNSFANRWRGNRYTGMENLATQQLNYLDKNKRDPNRKRRLSWNSVNAVQLKYATLKRGVDRGIEKFGAGKRAAKHFSFDQFHTWLKQNHGDFASDMAQRTKNHYKYNKSYKIGDSDEKSGQEHLKDDMDQLQDELKDKVAEYLQHRESTEVLGRERDDDIVLQESEDIPNDNDRHEIQQEPPIIDVDQTVLIAQRETKQLQQRIAKHDQFNSGQWQPKSTDELQKEIENLNFTLGQFVKRKQQYPNDSLVAQNEQTLIQYRTQYQHRKEQIELEEKITTQFSKNQFKKLKPNQLNADNETMTDNTLRINKQYLLDVSRALDKGHMTALRAKYGAQVNGALRGYVWEEQRRVALKRSTTAVQQLGQPITKALGNDNPYIRHTKGTERAWDEQAPVHDAHIDSNVQRLNKQVKNAYKKFRNAYNALPKRTTYNNAIVEDDWDDKVQEYRKARENLESLRTNYGRAMTNAYGSTRGPAYEHAKAMHDLMSQAVDLSPDPDDLARGYAARPRDLKLQEMQFRPQITHIPSNSQVPFDLSKEVAERTLIYGRAASSGQRTSVNDIGQKIDPDKVRLSNPNAESKAGPDHENNADPLMRFDGANFINTGIGRTSGARSLSNAVTGIDQGARRTRRLEQQLSHTSLSERTRYLGIAAGGNTPVSKNDLTLSDRALHGWALADRGRAVEQKYFNKDTPEPDRRRVFYLRLGELKANGKVGDQTAASIEDFILQRGNVPEWTKADNNFMNNLLILLENGKEQEATEFLARRANPKLNQNNTLKLYNEAYRAGKDMYTEFTQGDKSVAGAYRQLHPAVNLSNDVDDFGNAQDSAVRRRLFVRLSAQMGKGLDDATAHSIERLLLQRPGADQWTQHDAVLMDHLFTLMDYGKVDEAVRLYNQSRDPKNDTQKIALQAASAVQQVEQEELKALDTAYQVINFKKAPNDLGNQLNDPARRRLYIQLAGKAAANRLHPVTVQKMQQQLLDGRGALGKGMWNDSDTAFMGNLFQLVDQGAGGTAHKLHEMAVNDWGHREIPKAYAYADEALRHIEQQEQNDDDKSVFRAPWNQQVPARMGYE